MNSACHSPEDSRPVGQASALVMSVLQEVGELLVRLREKGESGAVDLRAMPLSDYDRDALEGFLGVGEVTAQVQVAGETEVFETSFAGVWWVRHKGGGGEVLAEAIEVVLIPDILKSDPADVATAAARLPDILAAIRQQVDEDPSQEETEA